MKTILKFITCLIIFFNYSIYGQQLVQSTKDVYKLEENEQLFLNKPLTNLLKEIKPDIKTVLVIDENFFCFYFITRDQLKKNEGSIEDSIVLFVYVKDIIEWQWEKRPKGKETVWSKEDIEKYGNLIVTHITSFNNKT